MLAAYLIAMQNMIPQQAISHVRRERPYSIETYEQEEVLWDFADYVDKKRTESKKAKQQESTGKASMSGRQANGVDGASTSTD